MVQIEIEFDPTKITELAGKMPEAMERGMDYSSQAMVRALMMNSPFDHGTLKSWFVESLSAEEAVIKTPAHYAAWVNDGTGPHWITPVAKKALFWKGAAHPVAWVFHPGIEGRHFVENSIMEVAPRLNEFYLRAIREGLS